MNRRHILGACAMIALGVALLPGSATAQQKPLKDQLVGTWTLVAWEGVRPDGSKVEQYGTNPKGIHVFTPDGRFYLMFSRPNLPQIASGNRMKATPDEMKAIYEGAIAYYGTYTANDADKSVTLVLEASTFPNQLTREQKRIITAIGPNELKYSNPGATAGGRNDLTFRRAE
jgi:hypothetical protein